MKTLAYWTLRAVNLPLMACTLIALVAFILCAIGLFIAGVFAVLAIILAGCLVLAGLALCVAVVAAPNILLVCTLRAMRKTPKSDAPGVPHFMG